MFSSMNMARPFIPTIYTMLTATITTDGHRSKSCKSPARPRRKHYYLDQQHDLPVRACYTPALDTNAMPVFST